MMNVIYVPTSLDDQSIESVFDQLAAVPPSARIYKTRVALSAEVHDRPRRMNCLAF